MVVATVCVLGAATGLADGPAKLMPPYVRRGPYWRGERHIGPPHVNWGPTRCDAQGIWSWMVGWWPRKMRLYIWLYGEQRCKGGDTHLGYVGNEGRAAGNPGVIVASAVAAPWYWSRDLKPEVAVLPLGWVGVCGTFLWCGWGSEQKLHSPAPVETMLVGVVFLLGASLWVTSSRRRFGWNRTPSFWTQWWRCFASTPSWGRRRGA